MQKKKIPAEIAMFEHSKISPHKLTNLKRVPRCVADRLHRHRRQTTGGSGDGRAHSGDLSSSVCEECLAAFERKEQWREELRNDKRERSERDRELKSFVHDPACYSGMHRRHRRHRRVGARPERGKLGVLLHPAPTAAVRAARRGEARTEM